MAACAQPLLDFSPPVPLAAKRLKVAVRNARYRAYGLEITPQERRLYRAVLIQSIKDLTFDPREISDARERAEAEEAKRDSWDFFFSLGRASDLMALCEIAQLDYSHVIETMGRTAPEEIRRKLMTATRVHALGCKVGGSSPVAETSRCDSTRN